jgi:hypothetical protein
MMLAADVISGKYRARVARRIVGMAANMIGKMAYREEREACEESEDGDNE